ncbi:amidohydrolase [Campylobacter jejuni]|nr:amidohydrolase [Campylobacter jejuni]
MHPELEFEEENTTHLVCKILDEFGIKYQKNIAKTGILAIIEGKKKSQKKTKMCSFKSGYGCFACARKN